MAGTDGSRTDRTARRVARGAGSVALWLLVWQLAAWTVGTALLVPGPLETLATFVRLAATAEFWGSVAWSSARIVGSFLASFACALALAALARRSSVAEALLRPPMSIVKATPVACIVVILLVWLGSARVVEAAVVLVALPAVYFSAYEALGEVDASRREMLRLFGVGAVRRALVLTWPSMTPFLLATCRMVVGMSWKAGVAAELIGMPLGSMGERIYQSKLLLETPSLFAWTAAVVLAAFVCERVFLALLELSAVLSRRLAVAASPRRRSDDWGYPREHGSEPREDPPAALALEGVDVSFGDRHVLSGASRSFPAGSRTCLTDPSGAGKTTALRLLAGLAEPDAGRVVRPARLSMAWQGTCLIEELSPTDNLLLVCGGALSRDATRSMLMDVLPSMVIDVPCSRLSGGERRRVELVRALAAPGSAVLLDEPFSSLDGAAHLRCASLVGRHLRGRTLVVATHDPDDALLLDAEVESVASEVAPAPSED